jgi:dihydrofolate reductase
MPNSTFTGHVIVGTTMSLDGFINDRNGDVSRLYPDLNALRETKMLQDSIERTGAVVMGRRAYDMAGGDLTGYEFQVPIFVLTHAPPATVPKGQNDHLSITFVTDELESAVAQAKAAAGDKDITVVGGAHTAQQILQAGLADELEIGIVPVLLGAGLRFFAHLEAQQMELELIETLESPGRTDLRFLIVK